MTIERGWITPERAVALLRVVVGFWFLKALWSKLNLVLAGGILPVLVVEQRWMEVMPQIVARQAAENPILWYKAFVEGTVLPNAAMFATLTAWGEALVGLSLCLGLASGLGALGGLFLSINYGIATWHISPASQGFHYTLVATMLALFLARSGRTWGLDGRLARRWPGRWFTRRPFA
jgi:uncharacterized membrane protein YphA (DoxX/SURF4 family)